MGAEPHSHKISQCHLHAGHVGTKSDIFIAKMKAIDYDWKRLGQEGSFETQLQHVGGGM
jgi:hypothetical protein